MGLLDTGTIKSFSQIPQLHTDFLPYWFTVLFCMLSSPPLPCLSIDIHCSNYILFCIISNPFRHHGFKNSKWMLGSHSALGNPREKAVTKTNILIKQNVKWSRFCWVHSYTWGITPLYCTGAAESRVWDKEWKILPKMPILCQIKSKDFFFPF